MSTFDGDKTVTIKAIKANNDLRNFRTKFIVPFRVTGRSAVNLHSIRNNSWYLNDRRNQIKCTRDLFVGLD